MKRLLTVSVMALAGSYALSTKVDAQNSAPAQAARPLVLTEAIPLEGVKGRIDHFGSAGNRLFVSALGNNTVEVIDISARTIVHTITGIPNPQGVVFAADANQLYAGSSKGKLYIYDGTSFDVIKEIDFHSDVDNVRYDAANKRVYVGYGEDETGAIGIVDVTTNERLDEEYKLGAHPESFQLETSGPNIYANLPDLKQIAVINRSTHAISRWAVTLQMNFPMALDETDHRLFVGTRAPARLAVFDTNSGHMITALPCVHDTDATFTTMPPANAFMWQAERDSSTFFNRRMLTTTSFSRRYPRHWAPGQPDILAKEGRARTASTWRFQRVRAVAQKCGFIP